MSQLCSESNARAVFLLERNGCAIASAGEIEGTDATALASLAASNVAATEGLAQLVGERNVANLYHEGEKDSLHLTTVGNHLIILVVFDERSSHGLVRLRVRKASNDLGGVFEMARERSRRLGAGSGDDGLDFGEITDADVEALFSNN